VKAKPSVKKICNTAFNGRQTTSQI